jgi:DNA-binding transcriptional MerR regulator
MATVQSGLTIGQVTQRTGLSVHTLRFYEREDILAHPVQRDSNGRRVYSDSDVEWLTICTSLRASGMPLSQIRKYAALVRQGIGNEEERLTILLEHREHVTKGLSELNRCLDLINYKVDIYEDRVAQGTAATLWAGSSPSGADQPVP